jgi:hypothetical protein
VRPDPEDHFAPVTTRFFLASCPDCWDPILVRQDSLDQEDCAPYDPCVLYPSGRRLDASVTKVIATSFDEASRCFEASLFTAAVIMCRRTLEAICIENGASTGSLKSKLKHLSDNAIIEKRMFDWAEALRFAGNDAAHDVAVVFSQDDARDLIDFTRALAEYIFTFAAAFQKFQARRASVGSTVP